MERDELPDASVLDAFHRQGQLREELLVGIFAAVNHHGALDDEPGDEHGDEHGDHTGWVVGVPHVWPVGNHRGQTLVLGPAFSNGHVGGRPKCARLWRDFGWIGRDV